MAKSSLAVGPASGELLRVQRPGRARAVRINDIDLTAWREYQDVLTDSLWIIPERDSSGAHQADYHGNFVPQIPHQMMLRYTRRGDVVIDPFVGCGTTAIEGRRLGRHVIGIELQKKVSDIARERVTREPNPHSSAVRIFSEDTRSSRARIKTITTMRDLGYDRVQLIVIHPPYHDIIKFSEFPEDLSNAPDLPTYLRMFREAVDNYQDLLEHGRYLVLVIGDKYADGEWVPLGFHTMHEVLRQGFSLKSIVVKNMCGNRAKRNLDHLWRYRALSGGFFIFKHEYVMVFRKTGGRRHTP